MNCISKKKVIVLHVESCVDGVRKNNLISALVLNLSWKTRKNVN